MAFIMGFHGVYNCVSRDLELYFMGFNGDEWRYNQ